MIIVRNFDISWINLNLLRGMLKYIYYLILSDKIILTTVRHPVHFCGVEPRISTNNQMFGCGVWHIVH